MMSMQIDPLIFGAICFLAIAGTASGWIYMSMKNNAIDQYIPFAPKIRKAISARKGQKVKSLLILLQSGTYTGEIFVGEDSPTNQALFDFSQYGIGEHLKPESYVKPLILDGIKVFIGTYTDAEFMGVEEIKRNNRLKDIQAQIPNLRGLPLAMLNTMLHENMADWEVNCENILYNIKMSEKQRGIEYVGVPRSKKEFITLLTEAKRLMNELPEQTSDVVVTTYESVIRKKLPGEAVRQSDLEFKINCLIAKLTKKPMPQRTKPADIEDKYVYKQLRKSYKGIKFLSPSDAADARDTSGTVSRLQDYGMQMKQMGKLTQSDKASSFMEKYGKYLFAVGIFIFICCVGLGVLFILLNK